MDLEPLMTASRTMNAIVVQSLASVDEQVSVPQLRVLVILSATEPLNLTAVADQLGVSPSNASRTCDQLVLRELVIRREDPNDRRNLALTLAPAGRRLLTNVMRRREKLLARVVSRLTPEAQERLMVAIEEFNAAATCDLDHPTDDDLDVVGRSTN